ncbi:MAG: 23S rRNA (guanosine(2251)-2'-O)-methyltransferase RlmB [Desulfovibrio sp.]
MRKKQHGHKGRRDNRETEAPRGNSKTFIAGRKPVKEMLLSSPERIDLVYIRKGKDKAMDVILDLCRENKITFRLVDREEMDRIYSGNHQGVAAQASAIAYMELDELMEQAKTAPVPLIVVLDQVQDPGNVGTLVRTLYALGCAGVVVGKHGSAYLGEGAVRASAGALSRASIARVSNIAQSLDKCQEEGFFIYGAQKAADSQNVFKTQLATPAVLVLGSEEKGIRPGVQKRLDVSLEIPFGRDFDSLNVAQAGAIIMGQFAKDLDIN